MGLGSVMESLNNDPEGGSSGQDMDRSNPGQGGLCSYLLIWSPLLPSDQGWRSLTHSFIHLFIGPRIHSQTAIKSPGFLGAAFLYSNCHWTAWSLRGEAASCPRVHSQQAAGPEQKPRLGGAAGQGSGTEGCWLSSARRPRTLRACPGGWVTQQMAFLLQPGEKRGPNETARCPWPELPLPLRRLLGFLSLFLLETASPAPQPLLSLLLPAPNPNFPPQPPWGLWQLPLSSARPQTSSCVCPRLSVGSEKCHLATTWPALPSL